jgi:hypothetical protein
MNNVETWEICMTWRMRKRQRWRESERENTKNSASQQFLCDNDKREEETKTRDQLDGIVIFLYHVLTPTLTQIVTHCGKSLSAKWPKTYRYSQ